MVQSVHMLALIRGSSPPLGGGGTGDGGGDGASNGAIVSHILRRFSWVKNSPWQSAGNRPLTPKSCFPSPSFPMQDLPNGLFGLDS